MLAKVLAVTHSKVALAVLGIVLVGGGGGAAVAASTGHLSTLGINLASQHTSSATPGSHAHTIGVEGLLTACATTATPATITVKDSAGKSWTFVVSASTKITGDTQAASSHGASSGANTTGAGASSAKGDNSTHAGGASSAKGDNSAHAGGASSANAGDNSAHAAPTLADVCVSANIGTRDVQVQATQDGSAYDAWKVTLQGPGAATNGSGSNGSNSDASGD